MDLSDCMCDTNEGYLERVRYFSRQLLDAHDLTDDQSYHRAKQRMHNRLLHGWGIVCGLEVKPTATTQTPLNVTICPGFALSPQGDEICVSTEVQFDLATCTSGPAAGCCSSPCSPIVPVRVDPAKPFLIAIKYAPCPSRPVRVSPVGCGCDDTACEYSRIRDGYEITCLPPLPDSYFAHDEPGSISGMLEAKVIPCPPCPDNPWVVLAEVTLVTSGNLTTIDPNPNVRRILLRTAVIQDNLNLY